MIDKKHRKNHGNRQKRRRAPGGEDPRRPASAETRPPQREPDRRRPERGRPERDQPEHGRQAHDPQSWIYGTHTVLAALANPERACLRLVATLEAAPELEQKLAEIRRSRPILPQIEILSRGQIEARVGADAVHQGIAVLAGPPMDRDLGDICRAAQSRDSAVVVVLDQVEDPRNVGAVMRSAAAFGALAVVVTERHAPQQTASLAKAASGALDLVPLVRVTNLVRGLAELKDAGFWVAGLDAAADTAIDQARLSGKITLVLGAEGRGLRRLTRENCDLLVRIPIAAEPASLNVSNAAAIALYAAAAAKGV